MDSWIPGFDSCSGISTSGPATSKYEQPQGGFSRNLLQSAVTSCLLPAGPLSVEGSVKRRFSWHLYIWAALWSHSRRPNIRQKDQKIRSSSSPGVWVHKRGKWRFKDVDFYVFSGVDPHQNIRSRRRKTVEQDFISPLKFCLFFYFG